MLFSRAANYPNGPPPRSPGAWGSRVEPSSAFSILPVEQRVPRQH
jgi:hypothetical protein